ncbi:DUF4248 domain-containing protein [Bacteroides sp. 51]|uniref:DUF4248 domain-containing protein n=1 Tax=Bacteroides sp. 51 TaxID=2302938 RepID=UPI0013CF55C8|nr:DUF4248 domain-containing protein [Bacteroides sp. 51]NDV80569.1 DUF4248 domain-containing protein [Bacteroides sp. 51]
MQNIEENNGFVYRSYNKAELARMYVPDRAQRTAMRMFNKWLTHHPPFWKRLQREGITIKTQIFNTAQVRAIVDYLGEP